MTLGNAHTAYNRFVEKTQDTFLEAVNDIAYDGMHNDEDANPPAAQPNPTSPAEDTTPGARSPFRSPTREAAKHALLPLALYAWSLALLDTSNRRAVSADRLGRLSAAASAQTLTRSLSCATPTRERV